MTVINMNKETDVIIIGAGSAGMTAAIYLRRANLNVIMIEANAPGGQINRTARIENYPGLGSIEGPSLAMNMFEQTQNLGIEYRYGNVSTVKKEGNKFIVNTDVEELTSKAVIIASGRRPNELGLENEKNLTGRGISWCAVCDGPFFKDKEVVVIGGGNSALEEALYLTEFCKKVTIIHRRDEFRGDKENSKRVMNHPKIEVIFNSVVTNFNEANERLESIDIENVNTRQKTKLKCDGVFIYIGFSPATRMVKDLGITDDLDYIITDQNQRTKIKGLYACGDVVKKELYQIVTATSEGAIAAMSLVKDLY